MSKFADHDAYIAAAPEALQPLLTHLRAVLSTALPGIEEIVSYDMPGFASGKEIVAGYAAFAAQCGLYVDARAIAAHADAISAAGLKATKTGVKFSPKKPIPDQLAISLAVSSRKALGV